MRLAEVRARYHRRRYRGNTHENTQDLTPEENEELEGYLRRQLGDEAILPSRDGGLPARSTQRRQRRHMAQTIEEIQREIEEGPPRRIGPYGTELDPRWW